jgi:hypothetical protein
MTYRRETDPDLASKPAYFFEKELVGEGPPSFASMQALCTLARDLFERHPWDLLAEDQLVLVEGAALPELCFCSVMGALGQVRALHVYTGPEGYRLFRRLHSGERMTAGEFFAVQRSVYVEFARLGELTAADRGLLKAMGHRLKRGTLAPIFRSIRPGYHPWYVTEGEARMLAECQRAVIAICDMRKAKPALDFWQKESVYPLLSRRAEEGNEAKYEIKLVQAPSLPQPIPDFGTMDEARIQRIRDSRYPFQGVLEVDHFYGVGMIGEKNQRKSCFRVALAVDAQSGFVYAPEVSLPGPSTGDVLMRVTLRAIESACGLPREVHVRSGEFKVLLEPLAQALRFSVKAVKFLPALESAKAQFLEMMGDAGLLPLPRR